MKFYYEPNFEKYFGKSYGQIEKEWLKFVVGNFK